MRIHHYHPETGLYLGSSEADESPLEPGVWLIPANATTAEPPPVVPGTTRHYAAGGWEYREVAPAADSPIVTPAEVSASIRTERDRRIRTGGYPLDGLWYHSDAYSLAQQQGLILAAIQVQAGGGDLDAPLIGSLWTTMSGERVTMSARLALRLLPAATAQQVAIYEAARAHLAALAETDDPDGYNWSGGWPEVFGDSAP